MHDIPAIKERLNLVEIFRRDGHEPRRMGAGHFVPCPFHDEKTPSCKVEEKRFHCFGCGAAGDVLDYWERTRGIARPEALDQLASLAGIAPVTGYAKPLLRPAPRPLPEEIIAPLTADERAAWLECVDTLRRQPKEITRIAAWRGVSEDVILWALERGIIGLKKWGGQWREAFLVEMPESPSGPLLPVSTHIRLAPHSKGNERDKASWRFDPVQRGAWPLIFGDPSTARYLFLVEGQWDALALVHIMRWHRAWPATSAIIAMRGATSFRKLISHYALNPEAIAFAFADADAAGAEWFKPDGLVHQISAKVRRVHSFWPAQRGSDLNDLIKSGFSGDDMRAILARKLPSTRMRQPSGPTFLSWCRNRIDAPDSLGRAARMVCTDKARPRHRRQSVWESHWRKLNLTPEMRTDLSAAWVIYKAESAPTPPCPPPPSACEKSSLAPKPPFTDPYPNSTSPAMTS
jgi:hypothetical protein